MKLSVLNNAYEECCTYYTGSSLDDVKHLEGLNCTLVCGTWFRHTIEGVSLIKTDNPQIYFYKLANSVDYDYLDYDYMFLRGNGCYIHKNAKIHPNTKIGPNCIIGDATIEEGVSIGANTTVYSKTTIQYNSKIGSGVSIGAEGVMWCDDGSDRVRMKLLGDVIIHRGCFIGDNTVIVRGSANESTIIGEESFIAPGTNIGHGVHIGKRNHIANNVAFGGSSQTGVNVFVGCGCTISPGKKISNNLVIGAGATVVNHLTEEGVYVGTPAKKKKDVSTKMSGIPNRIIYG